MTIQQPTRRNVALGAAWSIPTLAMSAAAPAIAASQPCTYTTAAWGASTGNSIGTSSGLLSGSTAAQGGTILTSQNLTRVTVNNGVSATSGQSWLLLDQAGGDSGGQLLTMTFSQTVYCISFDVQDIDTQYTSATSHYADSISVSGFVASAASASSLPNLSISGSTVGVAQFATTSTKNTYEWSDFTSPNGTASFTYTSAAGLTTFAITYKNANPGSGASVSTNRQQVSISPIKFSTAACACA